MIEQFVQALARLNALKRTQRWNEAETSIDEEFQRLLGVGLDDASRLSETELLARLIQGEPTQAVPEKTFIVATLLREAAETAAATGKTEQSDALYLKALHLLLEVLSREEVSEHPEFVPSVDSLVLALQDTTLPLQTHAALMQYYERTGQFAKAEDELFSIVDSEPENSAILEFGLSFYRRILLQTDDALSAGNLPRPEAQSGMEELQRRLNGAMPAN